MSISQGSIVGGGLNLGGLNMGNLTDFKKADLGISLDYGVPVVGLAAPANTVAVTGGTWAGIACNTNSLVDGGGDTILLGHPTIEERVMSTAGDLSTQSVGDTLAAASAIGGLSFGNNGEYLFTVHNASGATRRAVLSTPYDIGSAGAFVSGVGVVSASAGLTSPRGLAFSNDGLKLYICNNIDVYEIILDAGAWDHSTGMTLSDTYRPGSSGTLQDLDITPDGKYLLTVSDTNVSTLRVAEMSTPWDLTTATEIASYDLDALDGNINTNVKGVAIDVFRKRLYIATSWNQAHQLNWTG